MRIIKLFSFLYLIFIACKQTPKAPQSLPETKAHLSPEIRYGALFEAVQLNAVFPDSKTFADCRPKSSTDEILNKYQKAKLNTDFDLKLFVSEHFELPVNYSSGFKSDTSRSISDHIKAFWPVLLRQPHTTDTGTLIPFSKPYIASREATNELNYWDSHFIILGLKSTGQWDLIENMVDNYANLIDEYGFIPGCNRTYCLSRSQAPVFSLIVRILAENNGIETMKKYLPFLQKEYDFWMDGMYQLSNANPAAKHVVRLQDGSILNRYWDKSDQPRPEAYLEDIAFVKDLDRPAGEVYRHIRSAVESGWEFSSRWLKDGHYLASIHTTDIIPVDLNALLYLLEMTLAEAYEIDGDVERSTLMKQKAQNRKMALFRYCWNEKAGFFLDYDFVARKVKSMPSLAAVYPLYVNLAEQYQADSVASKIEKESLKDGGLLTTLTETGQDWDAPNGWPHLQWIAIDGLRNYGYNALADSIKHRWIALNEKVYKNSGRLHEKYNVSEDDLKSYGEEHPFQNGNGWTNGVFLSLFMEELNE